MDICLSSTQKLRTDMDEIRRRSIKVAHRRSIPENALQDTEIVLYAGKAADIP